MGAEGEVVGSAQAPTYAVAGRIGLKVAGAVALGAFSGLGLLALTFLLFMLPGDKTSRSPTPCSCCGASPKWFWATMR